MSQRYWIEREPGGLLLRLQGAVRGAWTKQRYADEEHLLRHVAVIEAEAAKQIARAAAMRAALDRWVAEHPEGAE